MMMLEIELNKFSNWLMNNAGPIIRYRTAIELLHDDEKRLSLEKDIMASHLVHFWIEKLHATPDRKTLHGAKTENYENVMGKLFEFGLKKGNPALDQRIRPYRLWLKKQLKLSNEGYLPVFYRTLTAAFLVLTGYSCDEAVKEWVLRRLETVYAFAEKGNLKEAYVPQDSYPGFPKAFRNTPLLNPELYPDDELKLPWIHDINAFLYSSFISEDTGLRNKVEAIIKFIFSREYQNLHNGYGVVRHQSGRYYMMGWSVHLPAYFEPEVAPKEFGRLLLLLKLLGRSEVAKHHSWFKRSKEMLDQFKNQDGLISFPREFLPERRSGCWVLGHRMGIEENHRVQKAITCESTFRFLEIISQNT
ncbi:MAG TPA: hypothetical protein VMT42_04175 [candidate division Zixibacteria bacterium]|nr:hypothetical protein [candidate division Zixibacteria bacterium]